MNKSKLLLAVVCIALTACPPYIEEPTYMPIYMSRENLENSVKFIPGEREINETGKIYFREPYIFLNERYKGIHVINNSDPYNPVKEGFIVVPGCIDMAAKDNILYFDNAVDLVSFNLTSKMVTSRIRNVLPEPLPPDNIFTYRSDIRPEGHIIVDWIKIEKTEED